METTEIWRPVVGYEGLYQVSSIGNIRRTIETRTKGKRKYPVTLIRNKKIRVTKYGYCRIEFSRQYDKRQFYVHRIVASAFIPNPENKPYINHINLIKTENRIENLEWCTHAENMSHAKKSGVMKRTEDQLRRCSETLRVYNKQMTAAQRDIIRQRRLAQRRSMPQSARILVSKKISKAVVQMDLNGNECGQYPSIGEASKATNIDRSCISEVARGNAKTAGGFKWKFKTDNNGTKQ